MCFEIQNPKATLMLGFASLYPCNKTSTSSVDITPILETVFSVRINLFNHPDWKFKHANVGCWCSTEQGINHDQSTKVRQKGVDTHHSPFYPVQKRHILIEGRPSGA